MSKPGHNSTDNRLKSLADRIERLMDERDGIQGDIRDIYAEAKSAGYVPKVLRKAITRKRMDQDKRSEEDAILGLYEDALSPSMRRAVQMAKAGATSREIETETGIDHVTVTRSVSLNKKSETPESCGAQQGGGVADSAPPVPRADATALPHDTDDGLTIPAHLRGPSPANRRVV